MNDKSKKIIMITIIVLIIVIIGVLIVIRKINKNFKSDVIEYTGDIVVNDTLEKVTVRSNYYIVKNIVEKYYSSLCKLNETSDDVWVFEYDEETEKLDEEFTKEVENTKNRIYNFFDKQYVQEIGISTNNLQEKLGNYNDLYVLIKDMYEREVSGSLKIYFVFGTLTEKNDLEKEDFKLMIMVDDKNKTFNIYTSQYIDKYNLYELSKDKNFNEENLGISEIENRIYNKYEYKTIDDETYVKDLLRTYTQSIKYGHSDYIYDRLDENYKNKKFNEDFSYQKYIEENTKSITSATLKKFKINKYDNYNQYICTDQNGNYYIFRENAIMDYLLILDIYTIDLPEFTENYKIATTEEKVGMNIEKIVEALNGKDYNYVYSKLADEFKANYFKTYEDFEKYAENTFDIGNEVTYNKYTESENYCTYEITLKGKNKNLTKTIVMKLEEGTDFIMSFSVE